MLFFLMIIVFSLFLMWVLVEYLCEGLKVVVFVYGLMYILMVVCYGVFWFYVVMNWCLIVEGVD